MRHRQLRLHPTIRVPVTKTDPSPKVLAEQKRKIDERIARRDPKILERFIRRLNSWQAARCELELAMPKPRAPPRRWSLGAKALRAPALANGLNPADGSKTPEGGDKREIDRAMWRKPRGIRLTPTTRYIRNKLFPN
jgi:hypothetical protein